MQKEIKKQNNGYNTEDDILLSWLKSKDNTKEKGVIIVNNDHEQAANGPVSCREQIPQ